MRLGVVDVACPYCGATVEVLVMGAMRAAAPVGEARIELTPTYHHDCPRPPGGGEEAAA